MKVLMNVKNNVHIITFAFGAKLCYLIQQNGINVQKLTNLRQRLIA